MFGARNFRAELCVRLCMTVCTVISLGPAYTRKLSSNYLLCDTFSFPGEVSNDCGDERGGGERPLFFLSRVY